MHDSSQNDEIAQEVSCDSLDENMSINNSSLSTTFTTAGREKELLAPILVFIKRVIIKSFQCHLKLKKMKTELLHLANF